MPHLAQLTLQRQMTIYSLFSLFMREIGEVVSLLNPFHQQQGSLNIINP